MTRRTAILAVAAVVLAASAAWAHDGHTHTVMGTVAALHDGQLQVVQAKDGKTVTIVLNDKTIVTRGKEKLTRAAVVAGQRVVVDVGNGAAPLTAREVKLGAAQAAKK